MTQFLKDIQNNKEALGIFRDEAIKKGIIKESPLPELHHNYYNRYIKPQNDSPRSLNKTTIGGST